MQKEYEIVGIYIKEPGTAYEEVQKLMTGFGCVIRTRLGINNESIKGGIIVLDLHGDEKQKQLFRDKIRLIEHVELQEMSF